MAILKKRFLFIMIFILGGAFLTPLLSHSTSCSADCSPAEILAKEEGTSDSEIIAQSLPQFRGPQHCQGKNSYNLALEELCSVSNHRCKDKRLGHSGDKPQTQSEEAVQ